MLALAGTAPAAEPLSDSLPPDPDTLSAATPAHRGRARSEPDGPVSVVTADDIRLSGATTIPEVLRVIAGVDVVTRSVRDQTVAVRGLSGEGRDDGLVVTVDGRPAAWDAYGTALWQMLPPLATVERIEITRGPYARAGSPAAAAGLINIVTRSVESSRGIHVSLMGGEYGTLTGTALLGAAGRRLGLALAVEVDRTDEWRGLDEGAGKFVRGLGAITYRYSDEGSVGFTLGGAHTDRMRFNPGTAAGALTMAGDADFAQLDASYRTLRCRVSYTREDFDGAQDGSGRDIDWLTSAADVDLRHAFGIGQANRVEWGVGYRSCTAAPNDLIGRYRQQHQFGAFVDDDVRLGERWRLHAGLRYDYHPLAGSMVSPRGSAWFSAAPRHTLRLCAGLGHRAPSLTDSYLDYTALDTVIIGGVPTPRAIGLTGNCSLDPERLFGVELGYRGTVARRLTADMALFYRQRARLHCATIDTAVWAPGTAVRLARGVEDTGSGHSLGGEADVQYAVTGWLTVSGNYSLQEIVTTVRADDGGRAGERAEARAAPLNKFNLGLRASVTGFRVAVYLHWSQATTWYVEDQSGIARREELPQCLVLNARLGYALKNAEVSAAVFDLFDRKYREYPDGGGGDELRQKVTVQLTCRF